MSRRLILIIALMAIPAPGYGQALRIALQQNEAFDDRRLAWPVTAAVPLPQGQIRETFSARLVDDHGATVPASVVTGGMWRASGTVQWVQVRFVALPSRHYVLELDNQAASANAPRLARRDGRQVIVDTGALCAVFSEEAPDELVQLRVGGRDLIAPNGKPMHWLVDQNGTAHAQPPDVRRRVEIKEQGDAHAIIRCTADYVAPDGRRVARHISRYYFFKGIDYFKISHAFGVLDHTENVQFRQIAYRLPLAAAPVAVSFDAGKDEVVRRDWTAATQSLSMAQEVYRHYGQDDAHFGIYQRDRGQDEVTLVEGERAGNHVDVALADGGGVTFAMRWFWQQFPKELEVTADGVVAHLWSLRGGELDFRVSGVRKFWGDDLYHYWLNSSHTPARNKKRLEDFSRHSQGYDSAKGIEKSHELWIWPRAAQVDASLVSQFGRLADDPVLVTASPKWNVDSGVFGPMAEYDPQASGMLASVEATLKEMVEQRLAASDAWGDYGWWAFGANDHAAYALKDDQLMAIPYRFTHATYHRLRSMWAVYFRSGDRRVLDLLLPRLYHLLDIRFKHVADERWRAGAYAGYSTMPIYWWSHDTMMIDTIDFGMQEFHWAWLATGDSRFRDLMDVWLDAAREVVVRRKKNGWPDWFLHETYAGYTAGWARGVLGYLNSLVQLYNYSGDPVLKDAIGPLVHAIIDLQSPTGMRRMKDGYLISEPYYWLNPLLNYVSQTDDAPVREACRLQARAGLFDVSVNPSQNLEVSDLTYAWLLDDQPRAPALAWLNLRNYRADRGPRLPVNTRESIRSLNNSSEEKQLWDGLPRLALILRTTGQDLMPVLVMPAYSKAVALAKRASEPLEAQLATPGRLLEVVGPTGQLRHGQGYSQQSMELKAQHVYSLIDLNVPADAPAGDYIVYADAPLKALSATGRVAAAVGDVTSLFQRDATEPLLIRSPGDVLTIKVRFPNDVELTDAHGTLLKPQIDGQLLTVSGLTAGQVIALRNERENNYLALNGIDLAHRWIGYGDANDSFYMPGVAPHAASEQSLPDPAQFYAPGVEGQAIQLAQGRRLAIPTRLAGDDTQPLVLADQGTIEFWYQPVWDPRWQTKPSYDIDLVNARQIHLMCYGHPQVSPQFTANIHGPLNMGWARRLIVPEAGRWYHLAMSWMPWDKAGGKTLVILHIDGQPHTPHVRSGNYVMDSGGWAGRPEMTLTENLILGAANGPACYDELRVSDVPRYINLTEVTSYEFKVGAFEPARGQLTADEHTLLLLHFDGSVNGESGRYRSKPAAQILNQ